MRRYRRLLNFICIIVFSIAVRLNATVKSSPFWGMSESLEISIVELGNEFPGTSQHAAIAAKKR